MSCIDLIAAIEGLSVEGLLEFLSQWGLIATWRTATPAPTSEQAAKLGEIIITKGRELFRAMPVSMCDLRKNICLALRCFSRNPQFKVADGVFEAVVGAGVDEYTILIMFNLLSEQVNKAKVEHTLCAQLALLTRRLLMSSQPTPSEETISAISSCFAVAGRIAATGDVADGDTWKYVDSTWRILLVALYMAPVIKEALQRLPYSYDIWWFIRNIAFVDENVETHKLFELLGAAGDLLKKWVADKSVADKSAADKMVAEETVADEMVLDKSVAEETVAVKTVAVKTVAEETVAEETVAEETVAVKTVAVKTVPDDTVPDDTVPDDTVLECLCAINNIVGCLNGWKAFAQYDLICGVIRTGDLKFKLLALRVMCQRLMAAGHLDRDFESEAAALCPELLQLAESISSRPVERCLGRTDAARKSDGSTAYCNSCKSCMVTDLVHAASLAIAADEETRFRLIALLFRHVGLYSPCVMPHTDKTDWSGADASVVKMANISDGFARVVYYLVRGAANSKDLVPIDLPAALTAQLNERGPDAAALVAYLNDHGVPVNRGD